MIFGIGTDLVEIRRVARIYNRYGDKFARRILSEDEWGEFGHTRQPAYFLAKRLAAKEAAAKALGLGFRDGLTLSDIGVAHDQNGRPLLIFQGRAKQLAEELGVGEPHLSLADERDFALAFVTLLKSSSPD